MTELTFAPQRYRMRIRSRIAPLLTDPKKQAYAMVVLSLFTIAFFGILAIRPTLKTIAVLQRKIDDKNVLNQQLDDKINNLLLAQEEYQKVQPLVNNLYELLPPSPEFSVLLNQLETIAQNHNVTITKLDFEPVVLFTDQAATPSSIPTTPTDIEVLPDQSQDGSLSNSSGEAPASTLSSISFSVSFQGAYPDLVNVLTELNQFKRLITVQSIDVVPALGEEQVQTLTIGLLSRAYYYPL